MAKHDRLDRFTSLDVQLTQGARSRYGKMMGALDKFDELLPDDALSGDAAALREMLKHLHQASDSLAELIAYRKMAGID